MSFLYDNLIASVVSGIVFLILISIQMRATDMNVAETARNRAVSQAESFATWLEEDLKAAGRNLDGSEDAFDYAGDPYDNAQSPTGSTVREFEFSYRTSESAPTTTVTYSVAENTRSIGGEKRTVYTLNREAERNGNVVGEGSAEMLGYFDIQFVDKNGQPYVTPDAIRAVRVRFSVLAPFRNDESVLREAHRMVVVPYAPAQN